VNRFAVSKSVIYYMAGIYKDMVSVASPLDDLARKLPMVDDLSYSTAESPSRCEESSSKPSTIRWL